jgi:hypothetical protein
MTNLTAAISEAAEIIRMYNAQLAEMWMTQPFKRVEIANSFSRGFVKNEEDDAPAFCSLIIRIAYADQEYRAA